jgi:hypothetical protein
VAVLDDLYGMRSVIGLCAGFGGIVGGYAPELWGASSFSMASLLFSIVGTIAGIWAGVRIANNLG